MKPAQQMKEIKGLYFFPTKFLIAEIQSFISQYKFKKICIIADSYEFENFEELLTSNLETISFLCFKGFSPNSDSIIIKWNPNILSFKILTHSEEELLIFSNEVKKYFNYLLPFLMPLSHLAPHSFLSGLFFFF